MLEPDIFSRLFCLIFVLARNSYLLDVRHTFFAQKHRVVRVLGTTRLNSQLHRSIVTIAAAEACSTQEQTTRTDTTSWSGLPRRLAQICVSIQIWRQRCFSTNKQSWYEHL